MVNMLITPSSNVPLSQIQLKNKVAFLNQYQGSEIMYTMMVKCTLNKTEFIKLLLGR